jgi:two-component system, OmpR family, response regulator
MSHQILVIDDEIETLSLLRVLLQAAGFDVTTAISPTEGLKLAAQAPPDLVLLDVMMPEMDGWTASQHLRQVGRMPIIFVSAKHTTQDLSKGLFLGDDYIVKPFDPRELVRRVRAQLEREASADAAFDMAEGEA